MGMNSLNSVRRRFAASGEVVFKPGIKTAILGFFGGALALSCVALGIGVVATWSGDPYDIATAFAVAVGALALLGFGSFLAFGLVRLMRPSYRMGLRMRVTRAGIEMAGLRIPWRSIANFETHKVDPRGTTKWLDVELCGDVADDGSAAGQSLARTSNKLRRVILTTSYLNVRHGTLLKFLREVHSEFVSKI